MHEDNDIDTITKGWWFINKWMKKQRKVIEESIKWIHTTDTNLDGFIN